MKALRVLTVLAAATALAAEPARAQALVTASCVVGTSCTQISIFVTALQPSLELVDLQIDLAAAGFSFTGPFAGTGFFQAQDDFGPYTGPMWYTPAQAYLDLAQGGFPFTLGAAGSIGTIQLEIDPGASSAIPTTTPFASFTATTSTGASVVGTISAPGAIVTTPEPATVLLLGAGVVALALVRRRVAA